MTKLTKEQIKRQKALAWLKRIAYKNPCMKEVKTCIEVLSASAQPVIPDQPDSQDLELWIDMLENSDSDDEDGELNNTQIIMWLKELQRRRALSAQPVIPEQRSPISFDALMAAVSEVTGAKSEFDATPEKCYQAVPFMNFNSLSRIVEMFRTAQPVSEPYKLNGWISVADRLPAEFGRYLCYIEEQNDLGKSHYQWNCSWNGDVFSDSSLTGRVTHWMPLPASPAQEQK